MPRSLLTPEEIADRLGVHRVTVYRWLRQGWLRGLKAVRQWRVTEDELQRFMREGPESERGEVGGPSR